MRFGLLSSGTVEMSLHYEFPSPIQCYMMILQVLLLYFLRLQRRRIRDTVHKLLSVHITGLKQLKTARDTLKPAREHLRAVRLERPVRQPARNLAIPFSGDWIRDVSRAISHGGMEVRKKQQQTEGLRLASHHF